MGLRAKLANPLQGDPQSDRIVPPSGFTARLTFLSAAAMAFLAVFSLALTIATGRLAERWGNELARSSTIRISAPESQLAAQTQATLNVLSTTQGVASARALTIPEQHALLAPWFGSDLPLDELPIPQLIEVIEDGSGFDAEGLRLRLAAEAPGAVLDDHTRWRRPLARAASRLRMLGFLALGLIILTTAAIITLAANAALAANSQVISVLRLIGAQDRFIAQAFIRRFSYRAFTGAGLGMGVGVIAVWLLPQAQIEGGFLTGLGFQGFEWLWPLCIPVMAGIVGYLATKSAALKTLRDMT